MSHRICGGPPIADVGCVRRCRRHALPLPRTNNHEFAAVSDARLQARSPLLIPLLRDGHARCSRLVIHPKLRAAGHFNRRLNPGSWSFPARIRLKMDFVLDAALVIKTLQIRQQGRVRELHRSGCWPRRSSHGRDPLGYRPCTLAPRPAPKSTATLSDIDPVLSLILSPEIAPRSSQKKYWKGFACPTL